jgi:hypothetical protein
MSRLLTVLEVAERLACTRNHVYRLIAKGTLRSVNIGIPGQARPRKRITEEALEEFMTQN